MDILTALVYITIFAFFLGGLVLIRQIHLKLEFWILFLLFVFYTLFLVDRFFYKLSGPLTSQKYKEPYQSFSKNYETSSPPLPEGKVVRPNLDQEQKTHNFKLKEWEQGK